eukprot:CAMPEP_0177768604 /NCGR_PEP_ID=MMETSP0491_2-20121128/9817_1 /TAXON_ID=63592 /ORGANISM="Tetraselmis chuii, Strain PLY429" /LENGTH=128 /DNA_ID=CAMNT_0019285437 /DNA_START=418 /DNA_END=805 /DNA_ORIENTATION=-
MAGNSPPPPPSRDNNTERPPVNTHKRPSSENASDYQDVAHKWRITRTRGGGSLARVTSSITAGIAPPAPPSTKGTSRPDMKLATSPTPFINGHLLRISGHTEVARHRSNGHTEVACHRRSGHAPGDDL